MKTSKKEGHPSLKGRLLLFSELAPPLLGGVHIESDTVGEESRVFISGAKKVSVLLEERIVLLAGRWRLTFLGRGLFATSYVKGTVSIRGVVLSVSAEEIGERG